MSATTQLLAELYQEFSLERGLPPDAAATLAGAFLIARQLHRIEGILDNIDDRLMKIADKEEQ